MFRSGLHHNEVPRLKRDHRLAAGPQTHIPRAGRPTPQSFLHEQLHGTPTKYDVKLEHCFPNAARLGAPTWRVRRMLPSSRAVTPKPICPADTGQASWKAVLLCLGCRICQQLSESASSAARLPSRIRRELKEARVVPSPEGVSTL